MRLFTFTLLACLAFGYSAQAQSTQQTFFQMIRISDIIKANLNLDGCELQIGATEGNKILIEVDVTLLEGSSAMLDYLGTQGRYHLEAEVDKERGSIRLFRPNNDVIMVKGKPCREIISYRIYIPKDVRYSEGELAQAQP